MMQQQNTMIRRVRKEDRDFWLGLDRHLPEALFRQKIRDGQGYVLLASGKPEGLLRYNLFWDQVPFCTLLMIRSEARGRGYGRMLMQFWESDMLARGYDWVLVSTRSDESAQHFYRGLGYRDCGSLLAPDQPAELFLSKSLCQG